jgi:hypothetical protein
VGLLLAALASTAQTGGAELSIDECRTLAEGHAKQSLAHASLKTEELGGALFVTFTLGDPQGQFRRFRVNATDGYLSSWRINRDEPSAAVEAVTDDNAVGVVAGVAHDMIGADADSLSWHLERHSNGDASIWGEGRQVGDPPRTGLSPYIRGTVTASGVLLSYYQRLPTGAEPAEVKVTEEQAKATALNDFSVEGFDVVTARLHEHRGNPQWLIDVSDYTPGDPVPEHGPRTMKYVIDAQSGEIVEGGRTASSGWQANPVPPTPYERDEGRKVPTVLIGVGAAALLLLVLAIAVLKRRA